MFGKQLQTTNPSLAAEKLQMRKQYNTELMLFYLAASEDVISDVNFRCSMSWIDDRRDMKTICEPAHNMDLVAAWKVLLLTFLVDAISGWWPLKGSYTASIKPQV